MPVAYCTLETAYGTDFGSKNQSNQFLMKRPQIDNTKEVPKQEVKEVQEVPSSKDFTCEHCNSCVQKNNQLQQRVVDQIISPRPQWYPQPEGYVHFDPFNRYWTNSYNPSSREDFGNTNSDKFFNIVIILLILVFLVQLVDVIFND